MLWGIRRRSGGERTRTRGCPPQGSLGGQGNGAQWSGAPPRGHLGSLHEEAPCCPDCDSHPCQALGVLGWRSLTAWVLVGTQIRGAPCPKGQLPVCPRDQRAQPRYGGMLRSRVDVESGLRGQAGVCSGSSLYDAERKAQRHERSFLTSHSNKTAKLGMEPRSGARVWGGGRMVGTE